MRQSRRSFVRSFLLTVVFSLIRPAFALSKLAELGTSQPLAGKLARFFVQKKNAGMVGLEYLRHVPEEADVDLLIDLICSFEVECREEITKADIRRCRELLVRQVREDFEQDRTVNVRGWILSETEARLCALAALI